MNEEFQDIEETGAYATVTAVQDDNYDQQRLAAGKEFSQGLLEEQKEITEDTLRKDPAFAEAYKVVNKFLTNEDIEGTNEELADQGFQLASDFKNAFYTADNGLGLVGTYNKFKDAPKDVKESAWYLWNNYEEADMTWGALGRGLKSMGTDPSTYTGVAAGWSFFGKIAARSAAKKKMQDLFLGGVVGGSFTGGEEFVKQEIQDITEKDWEQIGLNTSIGAVVGVASIPAIDYSVKGFKAAGQTLRGWVREGNELMMQQAGGGTPNIDNYLEAATSLQGKQLQQHLNKINMRDLSPEDKAKVIDFRKQNMSIEKKSKKAVEEEIKAQELFQKGFYSKAEDVVLKTSDDTIFKTADEARDYLQKQGVKKEELLSSGLSKALDDFEVQGDITKQDMTNALRSRNDLIQVRSVVEESGNQELDIDSWRDAYVDISERDVSTGDSGYGTVIRDDSSGMEMEIGTTYNDDVYVDDSGFEYYYDEMQDDWYSNYYNGEYRDDSITQLANEKNISRDEVFENIDLYEDEIKDYEIAAASDEDPWYDYYGSKINYIDENGKIFEDMDTAVEETLENMHSDYLDMGSNLETYENYTIDGGDNYDMEVYNMPDFEAASGYNVHTEPHLTEYSEDMSENVAFHVRKKERKDSEGNKGTVLEEVQSQWEQDWRAAGGGQKERTPREQDNLNIAVENLEKRKAQLNTKMEEIKNLREPISKEMEQIRIKYRDEAYNLNAKELEDVENQLEELKLSYENTDIEMTPGGQPEYRKLLDLKEELLNQRFERHKEYKDDPRYRDLEDNYEMDLISEDINIQSSMRLLNAELRTARERAKVKKPTIATPPLAKRTQYQKLALMDQLKKANNAGHNYFGFINGHIQNGSRIETTRGMIQAYDVEMPRIIQKLTGEKPYMASFSTGKPVTGEKVYWDAKKAEQGDYYDKLSESDPSDFEWYWRIDITNEIREKLNSSKIQMYTNPAATGAAGVGAAWATSQEGESK